MGLAACLTRVSQAEPIKAEFTQVLILVPKIILLYLCWLAELGLFLTHVSMCFYFAMSHLEVLLAALLFPPLFFL